LAYSAPHALSSIDDSLAVEAYVDSDGRVQNYRVLSAGKTLPPQTKNMLTFTTFRPATFMGKPTNGTAALLFFDTHVAATSLAQKQ